MAYALTTHPGHHSTASTYGGYCYLNESAIAARLLQQSFGKCAILDIDYHAGNGEFSISFCRLTSTTICLLFIVAVSVPVVHAAPPEPSADSLPVFSAKTLAMLTAFYAATAYFVKHGALNHTPPLELSRLAQNDFAAASAEQPSLSHSRGHTRILSD